MIDQLVLSHGYHKSHGCHVGRHVADLSLHISVALLNLSLAFIQLSLRLGMRVLGCKLSVEPLPPVQAQLLLQGLLLLQCLCITLDIFTAVQIWRCDQPGLFVLTCFIHQTCQVQARWS